MIVLGNVHKVYVNNALVFTYIDTNNLFLTQTTVQAVNQSGGATHLAVWPRDVMLRSGI